MREKDQVPWANFMDLLLDAVCVVDAQGNFVFVSAACERIFGYTPEEMVGKTMIDFVAPEDRERTLRTASEVMSGQSKFHFENRYVRKDGRLVDIMWSARWLEAEQLRIGVARDVTERKRSESVREALYAISEAAHNAEDLDALFRRIHETIGRLMPADGFCIALGGNASQPLGFPYLNNMSGVEGPQVRSNPSSAMKAFCAKIFRTGQAMLLPTDPQHFGEAETSAANDRAESSWLGVPLLTGKGAIGAMILQSRTNGVKYGEEDREILQFVSSQIATAIERKQLQERLQYLAQYDDLTGLPNRGLLFDRFEMALSRARRHKSGLSVLYVDLDDFKQINDTYGHAVGDALLKEVANRLRKCVRESDTVARLGGDEFVILLEKTESARNAALASDKIRQELSWPVVIAGQEVHIKPSIGIACHPEHGDDIQGLLRHADIGMYAAKHQGRNSSNG